VRLLFTIPDFWPHVRRGSERLVNDLAREMARRGHEVTVVTRDPAGRGEVVREGRVTVRYQPAPNGGLVRRLGWDDLEAFSLTAFLAGLRESADVMHAFYFTDAYGLSLAAPITRRPLVISFHGPPGRAYWERVAPRSHAWLTRAMARARAVAVISEDSARRMLSEYGFPARLLVPGTELSQFHVERQRPERRTVVCAAAVDVARKRIDLLLDAFAEVAEAEDDLGLLLVGHGDPASLWEHAAHFPVQVRERIEHRPVASEELPEIYASCTAGALTSESEAFGLVVLEYLAAGMPALGTDDGGIPEIVSADTGRLFPAGNVTACADQLREVLSLATDPATEARCRARAATFDWSVRGDAYEDLYRELAG
jgi:phosphatidyl-myo-inositol alpha-mannosyltransferase